MGNYLRCQLNSRYALFYKAFVAKADPVSAAVAAVGAFALDPRNLDGNRFGF
jgi:hypothetical protein